jgi:hypothetical protein
VAIGSNAGQNYQNAYSVAIGASAGLTNQGHYSIAIGAYSNAKDKSIVMNASGTDFHPSGTDGFFVKPIRTASGGGIVEYTNDGEIIDTQVPVVGLQNDIFNLQAQIDALGLYEVTQVNQYTDQEITIQNNLIVTGNLRVDGTETIVNTEKLLVEDPIIELANNLVDPNQDVGIIMRQLPPTANVAIAYIHPAKELSIGYTSNDVHTTNVEFLSETLPVRVHGNVSIENLTTNGVLFADSNKTLVNDSDFVYNGTNVGIQNTEPIHALTIGSPANVYVNTVTQNIGFTSNIIIGSELVTSGIRLGYLAGSSGQYQNSVAIGAEAGKTNQGQNSISIGAYSNALSNSIVLNATGTDFHPSGTDGFFVKPIAQGDATSNIMEYTIDLQEVTNNGPTTTNEITVDKLKIDNIDYNDSITSNILAIDKTTKKLIDVGNFSITGVNNNLQTVLNIGNDTNTNINFTNNVQVTASLFDSRVDIGFDTGSTNAGLRGVAIGSLAGNIDHGEDTVAIGTNAGETGQNTYAVAIGNEAGKEGQYTNSVAVGVYSGRLNQRESAVAIGPQAGGNNQQAYGIAIGSLAGLNGQNAYSVAIGTNAGLNGQYADSVAIGNEAGVVSQKTRSVAIGFYAGNDRQDEYAVAIGNEAGKTGQNAYSVAIGYFAGKNGQHADSVAIGNEAGNTGQKNNSVAIGYGAGGTGQDLYSVAIGNQAGGTNQNINAVAIGNLAGNNTQGNNAIAIGEQAGLLTQKPLCIAIGNQAGLTNQEDQSIAIGYRAGETGQNNYSVAIGALAGLTNQGDYSIAIGANSNARDNSIVLNASGQNIYGAHTSNTYIKPIHSFNISGVGTTSNVINVNGLNYGLLYCNVQTGQICVVGQ